MLCPFSLVALVACMLPALTSSAHGPLGLLEFHAVQPSEKIRHAVDTQSSVDSDRSATQLSGPAFFGLSVGGLNLPQPKVPAFLSAYKIENPPAPKIRKLTVLDPIGGSRTYAIGPASFLLSPAQCISEGPPPEIPHGLEHYKAYAIIDAPRMDKQLDIQRVDKNKKTSTAKRKIGSAKFICVPTNQWHHGESVRVWHKRDAFVIYDLDPQPSAETFAVIGQFGLNQLKSKTSAWLATSAKLIDSPTTADKSTLK
ncbi:MAG: hypothetical protein AAFP69_17280 [Planctomycetota bacterium]